MSPVKKSTYRWSLGLILVGGMASVVVQHLGPFAIGMTLAYLLVALGLSRTGI